MNKKLLIAWFNYTINGGISRFINISKVLNSFGHEVRFLSLNNNTQTAWPDFPGKILTLSEAKKEKWDAVMVPGAGAQNEILRQLTILKDAHFGTRIQFILNDLSLYERFAFVNKFLDPHIVITNNTHWTLQNFRKFAGEAFHFLPGAIDTEIFYPMPGKTIPIRSNCWSIGGFATKNPGPLLNALNYLPENYVLHIFGDIPAPFNKQVSEIQNEGRLIYWGPLFGKDLASFYNKLDIFVSTEERAGWCNSAAEATACGVPCVVSSHGTIDFAENMATALVLQNITGKEIADSVMRLTIDNTLYNGISRRGAQRMRSFNWFNYASKLLSIIYGPRVNSYFRIPEYNMWGKWDPQIRIAGLDKLLENSRGTTVLDLGAAEGVIGSQFADQGCKLIHGFELEQSRVEVAQKLLSRTSVDYYEFRQANLDSWSSFMDKNKDILLSSYDIVLFLGIYHHLAKIERLNTLFGALEKTRDWFAIRTPDEYAQQDDLIAKIEAKGFQLIQQNRSSSDENLGWLGIFRKCDNSLLETKFDSKSAQARENKIPEIIHEIESE